MSLKMNTKASITLTLRLALTHAQMDKIGWLNEASNKCWFLDLLFSVTV